MKNMRSLYCAALIGLFVFAGNHPRAYAADKFELKDETSLDDVIQKFIGKQVTLVLKSGHEISGTITKYAHSQETMLHLSALSGAEYYDAVVRVSEIAAISFRAK